MRRTRKWAFVAQEATRLASLGLSPVDIAIRLEVKRSTVQRWMAAGKIADTRRGTKATPGAPSPLVEPSEWAAAVRQDYALDATDDQLVKMAEAALEKALNPELPATTQLAAMRTFQGLVKQLALVARNVDVPVEPEPKPQRVIRRPTGDPRAILTAVK